MNGPHGIIVSEADYALDQGADGLLADVEAELGQGATRLRFSPALERLYATARQVRGLRHFTSLSLIGLLVYDSFLLTDWAMLPDVLMAAIVVQLGIVTPLCLLNIWVVARRPAMAAKTLVGMLLLTMATAIFVFSMSRAPDAIFLAFAFPLVLVYGNVVAPLPFRMALVCTVLCVVLMTGAVLLHPGVKLIIRAFVAGVNIGMAAFILQASRRLELGERAAYLLTLRESLRASDLARHNLQLRGLSQTDALTGIGNRRRFDAALVAAWPAPGATPGHLGLLLLDVDYFKSFNDSNGHQAGDRALCAIAKLLCQHVDADRDTVARYGGEEFAVLLPGLTGTEVAATAERIRQAVEALTLQLTVSIGWAMACPDDAGPDAMVASADAALYAAKTSGRNRVAVAPPRSSRKPQ